jgi:hypothetical protein
LRIAFIKLVAASAHFIAIRAMDVITLLEEQAQLCLHLAHSKTLHLNSADASMHQGDQQHNSWYRSTVEIVSTMLFHGQVQNDHAIML